MDGLHMRRLFVLDSKDYDDTHSVTVKNTVRAIICRDGRYAMQQNRDGIYKIPGGGVENNESLLDTLCRETLEETGLVVIRDSVREIGDVLELRRDLFEEDNKICFLNLAYKIDYDENHKNNLENHLKESENNNILSYYLKEMRTGEHPHELYDYSVDYFDQDISVEFRQYAKMYGTNLPQRLDEINLKKEIKEFLQCLYQCQ